MSRVFSLFKIWQKNRNIWLLVMVDKHRCLNPGRDKLLLPSKASILDLRPRTASCWWVTMPLFWGIEWSWCKNGHSLPPSTKVNNEFSCDFNPHTPLWRALWQLYLYTTQFLNVFFIIKPTGCTNFTNLFWHETLHVSDSSSVHHQEFIHFTLSNGICHTGL
jgi:hypothetical protein